MRTCCARWVREELVRMGLERKLVAALLMCFLAQPVIPTRAQAAPTSGVQANAQTPPAEGPQDEYAPLTADELDALVAPIALYPDALVAQVLGASTFPYEVVAATLWMKDNSTLKGEALAKAVDQQSWDPAVKALTQFPTVLDDLAKNLAWTSALGEASATQQQDVMAAVQRMRAKALAAGNLKSSPEIKVEQPSPQTIVIQPANPQIVYVPVYSPTVVYGAPIIVPGYYYRGPSTVVVVSFGAGVVVGGAIYGGCCGWGWSYWGTNWHSHTVIYNRNIYVGNSYWRGGYYGGGYYRPPGYRPGYPGYRPGYPGYRPPSYPGYGRPPATTLPAPGPGNGNRPGTRPGGPSTLPANPGTRPGGPSTLPANPGTRPGNGGPSTMPVNPGTRPGNGGPSTMPVNPGTRPGTQPSTRPGTLPSTQPSTRPAQPSQRPSTQPTRPDSFSGAAGGRAQSARGNQSMGAKGGGGGARRK
jgi:hypothetical protein